MCHDHVYLRSRWDRIAIGIRCAYNPWLPPVILHYLEAGRRLVKSGAMDETVVQRRMLTVLLQTAGDEALPWCWRAACLESTVRPRARLATLLGDNDTGTRESLEEAVQFAQVRLDAALLTGGHVSAKSPF